MTTQTNKPEELSGEDMIRKSFEQSNEFPEEPNEKIIPENNDEEHKDPDAQNQNAEVYIYSSLTAIEKEAYDQGWRPLEEFIKEGHLEENFVTAKEYIRYGKLNKSFRELQEENLRTRNDFDDRFKKLNSYHKSQNELRIEELQRKRRDAIENADLEQHDVYDKKIERLKADGATLETTVESKPTSQTAQQSVQQGEDADIIKWKTENSWINDKSDPRRRFAQATWNEYVADNPQGVTNKQAIAYVNSELKRAFPTQVNPMRNAAAPTEARRQSQAPGKKSQEPAWNDLTAVEKAYWNKTKDAFWCDKKGNYDEKGYIQSAIDSRR